MDDGGDQITIGFGGADLATEDDHFVGFDFVAGKITYAGNVVTFGAAEFHEGFFTANDIAFGKHETAG